jgi:hypothetical protein
MNRSMFAPALTLFFCAATLPAAFAQAQSAAPTTPAPAARTKWIAPIKGVATVQVIRGDTKRVGGDLVTTFKIKNTSVGAIALLRIDEYWYDSKRQMVSSDTQRWRTPINPGEVIEMSTKSPAKVGAQISQVSFTHANGKIDVKSVKKFN